MIEFVAICLANAESFPKVQRVNEACENTRGRTTQTIGVQVQRLQRYTAHGLTGYGALTNCSDEYQDW